MDNEAFSNVYLKEHRFWLQILGDHARFIYFSLAPTEEKFIRMAKEFITEYDNLLSFANRQLVKNQLAELNQKIMETNRRLKAFKTELLALSLESRLKAHLSATFFSHMINELEEYILILNTLDAGNLPIFNPIHYHLLWLLDATGHAAGVSATLDEVEKDLIHKSEEYEKQFMELYLKSINLCNYMVTEKTDFPALARLNMQADSIMNHFRLFLEDLRDQRISGRVLGTLMPLMADHMAREECYYQSKLSEVSNVNKPNCDPSKARIEG